MILWRISAFPDLSGRGGLLASGRWHSLGRPVVYLSDSAAAAMLEVLVHLEIDPEDVPDNFRLLRVEIPDDVPIGEPPGLPETWEDRPEYTRSFGDSWLEGNDSLLLPVPSAIMPHTQNYLFNPIHRDAGRAVLTVESLRLDRRLIRAK